MANAHAYTGGKQGLHSRKARYHSQRDGLLFKVSHQTPGTNVTGQTSYVATTPTFLIYQASGTRSVVGLGFWLSQAGTVAGATIEIAIGISASNLYSSGGTAITPINSDIDSATTASATFRTNPTTSGAPSFVWAVTAPATLGTVSTLDFEDGLQIGATGSIAIYTFATTTGPSWRFGFEWVEE